MNKTHYTRDINFNYKKTTVTIQNSSVEPCICDRPDGTILCYGCGSNEKVGLKTNNKIY